MTADPAPTAPDRSPQALAGAVLLRVDALTDRLVAEIIDRNPGYRAVNVVPDDDLWHSCHDNITRVLQLVADGDAGREDDGEGYYDAARATGHRRAEQGLPLDDVLRSFRLGGRLIWEALIDEAGRAPQEPAGLLELGSRVWEVVDHTSAQVAAAYHATERRLVREDEQRKVALWEGLLDGRAKDPAFGYEAARILGLPEEGAYAVVVADVRADVAETTRLLADELASRRLESAWHGRTDVLVGLVVLGAADPAAVAAALRGTARFPVGVSLAVRGLARAGTGYRQATLALRTLPAGGADVAALEERMTEALLVDSPALARRLVDLWLGPLLALPAAEGRLLLDTLEQWVATAGSPVRTAELVHCHRNTVLNRIRRVEALTAQDLSTGPLPLELALALRAHRLAPPVE